MRAFIAIIAATALMLSLNGYAAATIIAVDFQPDSAEYGVDYNGNESAAAAWNSVFDDAANTTWNHLEVPTWSSKVTDPSFTNLVDRAGTATSTGLSITGTLGGIWGSGVVSDNPLRYDYALFGVTGASTTLNFTISNLPENVEFKLYSYAGTTASMFYRTHNMLVDTNGDGLLTDETVQLVGVLSDKSVSDGKYSGVTSSTGTIVGSVTRATAEGDWAGFQLYIVPEPSALILLSMGLVSLLAYAWRRRK